MPGGYNNFFACTWPPGVKCIFLKCSLYSLLEEYGICVKPELCEGVQKNLETCISSVKSVTHKSSCKLSDLKGLERMFQSFFAPLEDDMKMLVYMKTHKSILFEAHLKWQLKNREGSTINDFSLSLKKPRKHF